MVICSGRGFNAGAGKKLIDAVAWLYGKDKKGYCDTCKAAARKKKKYLSCETCRKAPPWIWPENVPIYTLILLCARQLRVGLAGAFALDWNVVVQVANDMGVSRDEAFWRIIRESETIIIDSMIKNAKQGKANHGR